MGTHNTEAKCRETVVFYAEGERLPGPRTAVQTRPAREVGQLEPHELDAHSALAVLEANLACPTSTEATIMALRQVLRCQNLTALPTTLDVIRYLVATGQNDRALLVVGEMIACLDFPKCILNLEDPR